MNTKPLRGRMDDETQGPLSYRDTYGEANPWVRWLYTHAALLLRFRPRELWEGPDVGEMTAGEKEELRRLGKEHL